MMDQKMLRILTCPFCKSAVRLKQDKIICIKCALEYPIKNGMPIMLLEEAKKTVLKKEA